MNSALRHLLLTHLHGFTPALLANNILWLDANDLATLAQDNAGATPVTATGQSVGRWLDKSGQGNHVTQATGSAKPTYTTNGLNGLPVLSFDGGDSLDTVATLNQNSATLFAVIRTGTLSGTFRGILNACSNATGGISLVAHSSNNLAIFSGNGSYAQDTNALQSNSNYAVACTHNGVTRNLYKDGVAVATNSQALGSLTQAIRVGSFYNNSASLAWNGYVAEIAVYSRALSATEIGQLRDYAHTKYGTA